jgi:hypothetical protein
MVKEKAMSASARGELWETQSVADKCYQNVVVSTYRDARRMLFCFLKACSLSLNLQQQGDELFCFVLFGYAVISPTPIPLSR